MGQGTIKVSGGKIVPLSWAQWPWWCHHHPVCVCVYNEADSSRVGIRGQSSLYAVCRAPRQKHCWAVKHSVTKTTCSRVEDRQTQAASAAPHQELVPYHRGLRGSFLPPMQHSRSTWWILYVSGNSNQKQIVPDKKMLRDDADWCLREETHTFGLTHFKYNRTCHLPLNKF